MMVPKTRWIAPIALVSAAVLWGALAAPSLFASRQDQTAAAKEAPAAAKVEVVFLGNEKCPMTGKPIDKSKSVESSGQRVYFCCGNCQAKGKDMAADLVAKVYGETKPVKNEKCPITGKALDPEKSVKVSFEGHEVGFCCGKCAAKMKDQGPELTIQAMKPDLKLLGNKECPMMGGEIDHQTFASFDGKLVGFCCPGCIADFSKEPAKIVAEVEASLQKKDG